MIKVEALAARRALELAMEIGLDRVILEGDSSVLIRSLQSRSRPRAQFSHLTNDISFLSSHFTSLNFSHVRRHCNKVAHSLARRANISPLYQPGW